jgi:hypothetical protein
MLRETFVAPGVKRPAKADGLLTFMMPVTDALELGYHIPLPVAEAEAETEVPPAEAENDLPSVPPLTPPPPAPEMLLVSSACVARPEAEKDGEAADDRDGLKAARVNTQL